MKILLAIQWFNQKLLIIKTITQILTHYCNLYIF